MVFLGAPADTTEYLTSAGLSSLLVSAIEALGEEMEHRHVSQPLRYIGCWLKENHPNIAAERDALAEEAAALLGTIDADADGSVSVEELREHMTRRGLTSTQIEVIIAALDDNSDGTLSRAELEAGLRRARTGEPTLKGLMAAVAPPEDVNFTDLSSVLGGCFSIKDTARRAVTLEQLERIAQHVARRLGCKLEVETPKGNHHNFCKATWTQVSTNGERWIGRRPRAGRFADVAVAFADINLYDCNKYVISPATAAQQCSMVELMASEEQPPDYFVSHFWAEAILDFLNCLLQHSWARGLEEEGGCHNGEHMKPHPLYLGGRSPRYWVCAHANNQHKLAGEIVDDVTKSSFARAMAISNGTVSVVDSKAGYFERIWCVFELYVSLTATTNESYTYDVVTATPWQIVVRNTLTEMITGAAMHEPLGRGSWVMADHGAVAIIDGLPAQATNADDKKEQEEAFPLELIDMGIAFKCLDGKASMEKDKERILAAIGDKSTLLDDTVHGVLAHAALRRALEEGGPRRARFLDALRRGRGRKLQLSLTKEHSIDCNSVDTAETWQEVIDALDATTTTELSMQTNLSVFPVTFSRLTALESVSMIGCRRLTELPSDLFTGLTAALTSIDISGNSGATALPAGLFSGLTALRSIKLGTSSLGSVPEGFLSDCTSLTSINMLKCASLTFLPDGVFAGLSSLTSIKLGGSSKLERVPESLLSDCTALTSIDMSISGLTSIPSGLFAGLTSITSITTGGKLESVADGLFSGLTSLKSIEFSASADNGYAKLYLASVPEGLFAGLTALTSIKMANLTSRLAEGKVGYIPSGNSVPGGLFAGLAALASINMSGNFESVPEGLFCGRTNLTSITMSSRDLTSVPKGLFAGLASLASIDMRRCSKLTSLPEGLFAGLAALVSIHMESCGGLTSLPEGLFTGLASLTSIHMESCGGLTSLPEGLFTGLAALKKINMVNFNQFTSVPEGLFAGLTAVDSISMLGWEKLVSFPKGLFAGLTALTDLDIRKNLYRDGFERLPAGMDESLEGLLESNKMRTTTVGGRSPVPGECHIGRFSTAGFPALAQATGQWYYEMRLISIGPYPQIGWATAGFNAGDFNGVGDDGLSWGADGARCQLWSSGGKKWTVSWEAGDVVGFAADLGSGRLWAARNGEWTPTFENVVEECPAAATSGLFPAFSGANMLFRPLAGDDASPHAGPEPSFRNLLADVADATPQPLVAEKEWPCLTTFRSRKGSAPSWEWLRLN